ncbi:hypothetical protein [Aquabacterium sp. OR-4]|uniref:hypothetical protein n=1 Tax=Aquabacterium sp. OR-4 TaxID=2978127 RepID=UPI0021B33EED|nr:hypothetical protein [Aquabacterium sp. OR-4]MDT7838087.1 hypothetical protein [Aquabacterium sp. OR-4]
MRSVSGWQQLGAAAGLLLAAAPLQAHPHGALDCALGIVAQAQPDASAAPQLAWLDLRLTLDPASSQALLPRLPVQGQPPPADASTARQAVVLAQTLAGLFRQSGWMLQLQPAAAPGVAAPGPGAPTEPRALNTANSASADGAPNAPPAPPALPAPPTLPALQDPDPPRYSQAADGRLQVHVRLRPAADAPPIPLDGLALSCRDPVWYWLTGFTGAQAVALAVAEPNTPSARPCRAELGALLHQGEQAQALQAAARQAGAPGADQMPEALRQRNDQRATSLRLAC